MKLLNYIRSIFNKSKSSNEQGTELGYQIINNLENDLRQRAPKEISDYNRRILQESKNPNLYCLRGFAKENIKDYEGALNDYNKAIQIDENHSVTYYNIGLLKLTKFNESKGCQDLKKAADLGLQQAKNTLKYFCENKDN